MDATGSLCVAPRGVTRTPRRDGRPGAAGTPRHGGDARYMYPFFFEVVFTIFRLKLVITRSTAHSNTARGC